MKAGSEARTAFRFVLIIGIANLFADYTYEGARSVNGQFLGTLGATATVVGFTAGFGELIGYGFRSLMGLVTDRTGRYWLITLLGYSINMLAVPALALAGNWPVAAALIVAERTGRAIRKPATEAMLSFAGSRIGHGWVFGLNEALDQAGATLGPLTMSLVLWMHGGYRRGFSLLLVSGLISIGTVVMARRFLRHPRGLEAGRELEVQGLGPSYWWYMAAGACVAAGFADFALIGYHFQHSSVVGADLIPVYYSLAMGVGAVGGLVLGRLYDRIGIALVIGAFLVSAAFAPLVFLGGATAALVGMALWGLGMAAQDSLLKPLIARLVGPDKRGTAFGVFDTGFGVSWFLGSASMGALYAASVPAVVAFSVAMQLLALPVFAYGARLASSHPPNK